MGTVNPFILATAVLYLGGTAWSLYHGEWRMAGVWFSYGVSALLLAKLG